MLLFYFQKANVSLADFVKVFNCVYHSADVSILKIIPTPPPPQCFAAHFQFHGPWSGLQDHRSLLGGLQCAREHCECILVSLLACCVSLVVNPSLTMELVMEALVMNFSLQQLSNFKLEFIRIVCDHEHFIPLNLPFPIACTFSLFLSLSDLSQHF